MIFTGYLMASCRRPKPLLVASAAKSKREQCDELQGKWPRSARLKIDKALAENSFDLRFPGLHNPPIRNT